MIANFFNKSKPVNIIYLTILLLVYFSIQCFIIFKSENLTSFLLETSGLFFLNVGVLFLINFIVFKNKLIHNNYFPIFLVVLLFGIFPEVMFNTNLSLANLFLLLSFRKIFSLKSQINAKGKIFDSGFWIGLATLFYSLNILFIILVFVSLFIYKKVSFRNLIIPIIGFVVPIFLYATFLFYFDNLAFFYNHFNFDYSLDFEFYKSLKILIPILFLALILVWSIINLTPKYLLVNNKQKNAWVVLLWLLLISSLIVVLSPLKNSSELLFIVFPSAIIVANFIQKMEKPLLKNGILYLFLILSIAIYYL
jgi:hypothetical protein